jgi:hypothetical protein
MAGGDLSLLHLQNPPSQFNQITALPFPLVKAPSYFLKFFVFSMFLLFKSLV